MKQDQTNDKEYAVGTPGHGSQVHIRPTLIQQWSGHECDAVACVHIGVDVEEGGQSQSRCGGRQMKYICTMTEMLSGRYGLGMTLKQS